MELASKLQVRAADATCCDVWGLAVSTRHPAAVSAMERAVLGFLGHRADTLEHVQNALAVDPELALAHVLRGFAYRLLARRDLFPNVRESLALATASLAKRGGNQREQLLVAALEAFCEGDASRAVMALARSSEAHPTCLLSLKLHHALCFMYGKHELMRNSLERVLADMPDMPGRSFAVGCYAFALEETYAYADAERCAREALDACPTDAWAYHCLLHVMAMQDRTEEGLAFVRTRGARFDGGSNFVAHIAWHHALFALAERRFDEALSIYDAELIAALGRDYRDAANCVSLLYRLERAGVTVGSRWHALADHAVQRTGDHGLAFADAHYMLALVRAGRNEQAWSFLQSMRESILSRRDSDAEVLRSVGLPLAEGMFALGSSEARRALQVLWPLALRTLRLGGSHAQRELFEQIVVHAARDAGQTDVARELLTAQLAGRPRCGWALDALRSLALQQQA